MRLLAALLLLLAPAGARAAGKDVVALDRGWQLRIDPADTAAVTAHPRAAGWLPATVPGSAQQDMIREGIVPDPSIGVNEAAIQWVGLTGWQYRRTLTLTAAMLARDHLDLVFDGLDTFADVRINGIRVLRADNAHRRWRIAAKRALHAGDNEISVTFASPVRRLQPMVLAEKNPLPGEYDSAFGDEPKGKQTSPYIRKPKYHYGWDWGPRIVAIGPWRDIRLEAWDAARIETLRIEQEALTDAEARLSARLDIVAGAARRATVRIEVAGPDGRRIRATRAVAIVAGTNAVSVPLTIPRPRRWQPVGHGAQPLYVVTATLVDGRTAIDRAERRTGLREVTLLRGGGAFGFVVNGTPIFAKGANLIPFDSLPARVTIAKMRQLLQSARDANMNMIRVWGGGYYLDDAFYDMADEMGLMVWQDFMFGGAVTPPDAAFRENVRIEAEEQVARLQAHPSIVLWAGGNEVLSGWENWSDRKAFKVAVGANEQERIGTGMAVLFDRTLREAVTKGDADVPYWPGSPSTDYDGPVDTDAAGDRHFWDVWSGSKPIERYLDSCPRFMSEYGFQGMPVLATIRGFAGYGVTSAESAVMKAHQKFLAGEGNERITFYLKQYYRDPRDFADLVYLSQVQQAEAIRLAALHHRVCRPVTMGSLYWQLNDVWPAISWSSIDVNGRWKLLQFAARRFFAPEAIVAEHRDDATRIVLVSDALAARPARWRVRAMDMTGRTLAERGGTVTLAPSSATQVAVLADADVFGAADPATSYAVADLLIDDRVASRAIVERVRSRAMTYPAPGLTTRWDGRRVTITAARLARAVMLDFGALEATPGDNGFDLLPGESVTIDVASAASGDALAAALTLRTLGPGERAMILALMLAAADPQAAIATMTIAEKAAQLQSSAPADAEAGLPAYDWWNEGLHGLARNGHATVFPQAIGLAATWDEALIGRIGDVVSTEARARFNQRPVAADRTIYEGLTIWSPNINIFRDPRWGRGQETYGEDPYLTGRLGVAFIRGLQGPDAEHPKVIATPKHFAVHSGPEAGRDGFDVDPSPRDLEATYLPAFRLAVTEGKARSVMCAYNAIHGVPVCALPDLMIRRLRRDWGFTGLTVSDCDAVANIHLFHHYRLDGAGAAAAALRGGNDLNCGGAYAALPQAVAQGLVREGEVDAALTRVLDARRALGMAFGASDPWRRIRPDQVATPAHAALALEAARKAIVLLKNDAGRLPLKSGTRIAVIGANADDLGVLQGNYHGTAVAPVTPLDGIRAQFGAARVRYAQGSVLAEGAPVVVPETALRADGRPGLRGEYFAAPAVGGTPVATRQDRRIDFDYNRASPLPELKPGAFAVRWTGEFVPPGPGDYRLVLDASPCWKDCTAHDAIRLWIDGKPVVAGPLKDGRAEVTVAGDRPQAIRLEIDHATADEGLRLLWMPPSAPLLAEAVAAARDADVVVAVVGLSPDLEGEALKVQVPGFVGGDRTDLSLPEPQRRLIAALAATGRPLVLVLASGSAVALDPAQADAILAAWYPGEAGGTAIAETLAGRNNPSGRLPVTFYRSAADLPAFIDYGMKERTYRYFTGTPLWGFGHGLGFTRFDYADAAATPTVRAGATVTATVRLSNVGARAGEEVVQAYLVPPADPGATGLTDPVLQRALVGFRRIALTPGKRGNVRFAIDPRAMSVVDRAGTRRVVPGAYRLWIGGGQPGDGPGRWTGFTVTGDAVELPK